MTAKIIRRKHHNIIMDLEILEHTMKNFDWTWLVITIAAIIVLFAILSCSAKSQDLIAVKDGDTVVISGETIRLYGIDAPESSQPYGDASTNALAAMLAGKEIRISRKNTDRYGRTVAIVYADNRSINAAMVATGNAWAYLAYSSTYVDHERAARRAKRGLWALPCPVAPWQYRNG